MYKSALVSSVKAYSSVVHKLWIKSLKIMILFTVNNVKNSGCLCHETVSVIQLHVKFEMVNERELPREQ
jgi:hypothetical protein